MASRQCSNDISLSDVPKSAFPLLRDPQMNSNRLSNKNVFRGLTVGSLLSMEPANTVIFPILSYPSGDSSGLPVRAEKASPVGRTA